MNWPFGRTKRTVETPRELVDGWAEQYPQMQGSLHIPQEKGKVGMEDFDLLKVLGRGGFGKVMMVRHKATGEIYAMKVLHKEAIIARNQVQHTKTERNILQVIDHPNIVKLHYAFQSEGKLYLVLDYLNGGELFFHLKNSGRFPESRVRQYVAQLSLALSHLHSLDVIYRDLKPENILLDSGGHICITDFGLSKEMVRLHDDAKTFCGTPEYLAPEILQNRGHGKGVDWWSLGTLMFEMLDGLPPFFSKNHRRMYDDILNKDLDFEGTPISPVAQSLLLGLMNRDPQQRFGWEEVQSHEFFAGMDWVVIYNKEFSPEFVPQLSGIQDVRNFDNCFTREMPNDSPAKDGQHLAGGGGDAFQGFTFDPDNQYLDDAEDS